MEVVERYGDDEINPEEVECCWHIATPQFQLGERMAFASACCWHGETLMQYTGQEEPDHGPYARYPQAEQAAVGPKLVMPDGSLIAHLGRGGRA